MKIIPDRMHCARHIGIALAAGILFGPAQTPAAPPVYQARAQIVEVNQTYISKSTVGIPGAGVRSFRATEYENGGIERFDIRWYAFPPGIPPGTVLLLETIHERNPAIQNWVRKTVDKSENHIRLAIEIPSDEIRRIGRVLKWRLRVVWRGKVLSTSASTSWNN